MISVKPYMNLYAAASAYCSASVTLWAHSACSGIKTSPSLMKCCYFGPRCIFRLRFETYCVGTAVSRPVGY